MDLSKFILLTLFLYLARNVAFACQAEVSQCSVKKVEICVQQQEASRIDDHYYPKSALKLVTLGGRSYFFMTKQKLTWFEALSFCRSFGMDLATIETKEENDFITDHIASINETLKLFWLSGNRISTKDFRWIDGSALTYHTWHTSRPASYGHCLFIRIGQWGDWPCEENTHLNYDVFCICEAR